jgi:hypothetical protein
MIDLRPGDLFAVRTKSVLACGIRAVQKVWSKDHEAIYNHTGIIQDRQGATFEALWRYAEKNLYAEYAGCRVCVARYTGEWRVPVETALADLRRRYRLKPFYPVWRIPLHMIPPLAKISLFDWDVCSEVVGWWENHIGLRTNGVWSGLNPDDLHDAWAIHRHVEIIHEGALCR